MHIQLGKAWFIPLCCLKRPHKVSNLTLIHHIRCESTTKVPQLALDAGQADSVVDAPAILPKQSTLRCVFVPKLVDLLWWLWQSI